MTTSRTTLALRAIQPPAPRIVAPSRPPYVTTEGKARMAAAVPTKAPRKHPYAGTRWPYALHELARVDAHAEARRRARKRAWFSRPGYTGLDRVVAKAFAGLRAVSLWA